MSIVVEKTKEIPGIGKVYLTYNRNKRNPLKYFISDSENKSSQKFNYISVLPGSGKTHWALSKLKSNQNKKKYITIYLVPTLILLDQVYKKLLKSKVEAKKYSSLDINSNFKISSVFYADLMEAKKGDVFLITHQLYFSMDRPIPNEIKKNLFLIVDEASELTIEKTDIILDYETALFFKKYAKAQLFLKEPKEIEVGQEFNNDDFHKYKRFHMSEKSVHKYSKKINKEDYNKKIFKLFSRMSDPKFSVYAIEREKKFSFFNFYSPEYAFDGVKKVYLMSAFFELSELYHILNRNYTLVNRSDELKSKHKKRIDIIKNNFKQVTLFPIIDTPNLLSSNKLKNQLAIWSKKGLDQDVIDEFEADIKKAIKAYAKLAGTNDIKKLFNYFVKDYVTYNHSNYIPNALNVVRSEANLIGCDEWWMCCNLWIIKLFIQADSLLRKLNMEAEVNQFLYTVNKFMENRIEDFLSYGYGNGNETLENIAGYTRLSVKSHGLNSYTRYNNLIFLAAMNPDSNMKSFFSEFIPEFDANKQWVAANILQSIARLEVREGKKCKPCNVVVYSTGTANLVSETAEQYLGFPIKISEDGLCNDKIYVTTIRKGNIYLTESSNYKKLQEEKGKDYLLSTTGKRQTTEAMFKSFPEYLKIFNKWKNVYNKQLYLIRKLKTKKLTKTEQEKLTKLLNKLEKYAKLRQEIKIKIAKENGFDYKPNKQFGERNENL